MALPIDQLIAILAIFLLAGMIKGAIGMGLPTVSISLMAQFLEPRTAISLVLIPIIASNFWQFIRAGDVVVRVQRYLPFAITLCGFLLVVSYFALSTSSDTLLLVLGGVIVAFTVVTLAGDPPAMPERYDRIGQLLAGTIGGILGGLTAIWSPPMIMYFVSRKIEKEEFMAASGLLLFLGGLPLAYNYWQGGILDNGLILVSLVLLLPTFMGFWLGGMIRRQMNADRFQNLLLVFFMLMGFNLIRRALMG